jgi:two-component system sensor histidine kinase/response regulator
VVGAAHVHADPDLLRRVLENLVDNAIRHAPPQSAIRLSTSAGDGATLIRVADQGRGVPAEQRDKVFEAFAQGSAEAALSFRTTRGLGLAFCKIAVEAHGGTITIEDAQPGAVFCIRLPNP